MWQYVSNCEINAKLLSRPENNFSLYNLITEISIP